MADIFWAMKPGFPIPVTTTRPRQPRMISTAVTNSPSSRRSSEATAAASIRRTFFAQARVLRARAGFATAWAHSRSTRCGGYLIAPWMMKLESVLRVDSVMVVWSSAQAAVSVVAATEI